MMSDKRIPTRFQSLQTAKHYLGINEPLSLFDTMPHTEYWNLSDIIDIVTPTEYPQGLQNKKNITQTEIYDIFDFSPIRVKTNKLSNTDFFEKHVVPIKTNSGSDLSLTRYAVYNIINRFYPNNIFDLVYFMVPSDTPVEQIYGISQNFKRISEREKLKQQERYLAGVTKKYNAQFSTVQAILQNTLFGNTDMHKIKLFHHIPDKSPTADYMGAKSLRAKNNAIYNAIANIDTNKTTYNGFIYLIQKSAMEQRKRMQNKYGITPEYDISFQPISKTQVIFNQMRKKFIKQYAFETLR